MYTANRAPAKNYPSRPGPRTFGNPPESAAFEIPACRIDEISHHGAYKCINDIALGNAREVTITVSYVSTETLDNYKYERFFNVFLFLYDDCSKFPGLNGSDRQTLFFFNINWYTCPR